MAKNNSDLVLAETLGKKIKDLEKMIKDLRTNQLSVIVIPKLSADPSSPIDGQMWNNTASNTFKIRINGVTKTVTIT